MQNLHENKKGYYQKEDVDKVLANTKRDYESRLAEQKERIFAQSDEIEKLTRMLEEYKERNDYISRAITVALEKADQIEAVARGKYEEQIANLKAFHKKFCDYYEQILTFYPLDEELKNIGTFIGRMDKTLSEKSAATPQEEDVSQNAYNNYRENSKRLSKNGWQIKPIEEQLQNPTLSQKSRQVFDKYTDETAAQILAKNKIISPPREIKTYLDKKPAAPAYKIDLEEVLKPTQSLEDLCAELGLLSK